MAFGLCLICRLYLHCSPCNKHLYLPVPPQGWCCARQLHPWRKSGVGAARGDRECAAGGGPGSCCRHCSAGARCAASAHAAPARPPTAAPGVGATQGACLFFPGSQEHTHTLLTRHATGQAGHMLHRSFHCTTALVTPLVLSGSNCHVAGCGAHQWASRSRATPPQHPVHQHCWGQQPRPAEFIVRAAGGVRRRSLPQRVWRVACAQGHEPPA